MEEKTNAENKSGRIIIVALYAIAVCLLPLALISGHGFMCGAAALYAVKLAHQLRLTQNEAAKSLQLLKNIRSVSLYAAAIMLTAAGWPMLLMMLEQKKRSGVSLLALIAALLLPILAVKVLRNWIMKRKPENSWIAGLVMELCGWLWWIRRKSISLPLMVMQTAVCMFGACTANTGICSLHDRMRKTVDFACGDEQAFDLLENTVLVIGELSGFVLAILMLVTDRGKLLGPILLMVPALVLACCFPVSERFEKKLDRAAQLRSTGECPKALEQQLDKTLVKKRFRPVLQQVLIILVRVFYHHRVQGTENLRQDPENPMIILLNHGEMYGPVVGMAFTPMHLRPWMISELVNDPQEMAAYVHRFTISRQKWLPECLKWPLARLLGRISVWGADQLEAVAVYRNTPGKLMRTMRDSVDALQAGDNLLIFPENPDAEYDGHGYERSGVGTFFEGFAVLGRIYGSRTGKSCRFIPAFAHQGRRTLTFGHEICYDLQASDAMAEAARVSETARMEMLRIWQEQESKMKKASRVRLSAGEKARIEIQKDRKN